MQGGCVVGGLSDDAALKGLQQWLQHVLRQLGLMLIRC